MKFYKSFLFLFGLNFFLVWPVWFLLDLRFLIPAVCFLFFFNLFLLFFSGFYLKKTFLFSVFALEDSYGVSKAFEDLKTKCNLKNVQLLKAENLNSSFFYFSFGPQSFVVLSEDILESFSQKEVKHFLAYPFKMIQSGDSMFLTLLSSFLLLLEHILYFLNYPLSFFKKNSYKKENLIMVFVLKALSLMTKRIFYNMDKNLLLKNSENEREKKALLLWKLDGLMKNNPPLMSPFLAPLFLVNPLTDSDWGCYISLQPLIKSRVRSLIGAYPP